ncbi:MAG: VTT domain-containing protein [Reyranella sp.]|nr:VTT domain-containing protein [Reyranella sp.]
MRTKAFLTVAALLLGVMAIAFAWHFTGLAEIVTADRIRRVLAGARGDPWAPALVLAAYLIAGVVAFPVNILILATAAVFGPWLGFAYSALGVFTSAFLVYFVGAYLGKATVERLFGPKLRRILEGARKRGVLVVVAFRVVPVAPGTVVNLALGASGIRLADFAIGSVVGMTPGLLLVSIMGDRLVALITEPTLGEVGVLVLCVAAYLALVFVAQVLLSRRRRQR